ncbi:hypothetical protein MERGE_002126 [Pneumocystis wakefieldiae]|uniref:UBC core domain-containing protein n=1 Tax=Pneumocystis wakefieldiae TaxID=38082 RepID=A0A899FW18_9ASCO|nr:hypothetical protein MERGE_002126 [Pneumocystis wakefieldiae]
MDKPYSKGLNENSASVRRILQEIRELQGSKEVAATPQEDNIFEWHFTIRGVPGSEFNGGRYHGKIFLPPQYPFRPPSFRFCHENGRFSVNKDICLNISSFHEELWQPVWGIHTALISLSNFMLTKADGHIGGLDFSASEKKKIALQSREWVCPECNKRNIDILPDLENEFEAFSHSDIPKLCFSYKDEGNSMENRFLLLIYYILLYGWLKKGTKMKFIPKFDFKRENQEWKELSDMDTKKEKLPSLMESDQAKMGLNIRQIEDEVVEIKEEESKDDIYGRLSLMGCPAPNMGSQEKKNIVGDEGLGLDQGKELFEADEEGVLMLNMEKLNMLTNNEDPVDLEDTVLNDKLDEKDGLKAIRNDSSAYDAQEKSSRSTSLRLLNKKAKKKGNSTLSVEEEQEREKSDELLFFQFPPILPALLRTGDEKIRDQEIKIENEDIMEVDSEENISHKTMLLDHTDLHSDKSKHYLPDGCVGQLKIRKSGKTTILWGGIEMNVSLGSNCEFLQDIVAVDYKNNKKAWLMGRIKQKFIVTPDIEQLLE